MKYCSSTPLLFDVQPFYSLLLIDHMFQSGHHLVCGEGPEPKPRTPRLDGRDDFRQVVTDDAEPSVLCELLYDWNIGNRQI